MNLVLVINYIYVFIENNFMCDNNNNKSTVIRRETQNKSIVIMKFSYFLFECYKDKQCNSFLFSIQWPERSIVHVHLLRRFHTKIAFTGQDEYFLNRQLGSE